MAESNHWAFPANLQPKADEVAFDFQAALDAVVMLRAEIPQDAFTASTLGTERIGSGVVIRNDGLILTIGYLITESQTIWITTNHGQVIQGHALAYDQETGFGLVVPLGRLKAPMLPIGSMERAVIGDDVIVIGYGGRAHSLKATIIGRREFVGYWEYVLDDALFTAPAHPEWGGTALVDAEGRLIGIGSLHVQETIDSKQVDVNMMVPIDLLTPILDDMLRYGRPAHPARPWLGMYVTEADGHLVVGGMSRGAPADRAGVRVGDLVIEVNGERVQGLAELFRRIWRLGAAGVDVPLMLTRDGAVTRVRVRSADRADFLKKPQLH
jgi:S1-C subfamily serine protease